MKYKTKKAFVNYFSKLQWYCINWDFNKKCPVYVNVLSYINSEDLFKMLTYSGREPNKYNCISSDEEFYDYVRSQLSYRFSGDATWEMSLGYLHFRSSDDTYKLSVFDQIKPNLNHIINYLITELSLDFTLLDITKCGSDVAYV